MTPDTDSVESPPVPKKPKGQCGGPECDRGADVGGLCWPHYQQQHRGKALQPLRPTARGEAPRVSVRIRVSPEAAKAVAEDLRGAVAALERWAAKRR